MNTSVIAGPAGHWYALDGDALLGLPMSAEGSGFAHDINDPPKHPSITGSQDWYEITDPAPETDDEAIIAALKVQPALDAFKDAAVKLSLALEQAGVSEIDGYPDYLPSFDEFSLNVLGMSPRLDRERLSR